MASRNTAKPATALADDGLAKGVCLADKNASEDSDNSTDKQLIDRFGKRHSEAVLVNWSPQMIAVMRLTYTDGRPVI